jgi:hypothetical protein
MNCPGNIHSKQPIVIEQGIPMAPLRRWSDLFRSMAVGDSVVVPTQAEARNAYTCAKRKGYLLCTRRLPDGTYRLWRAV